MRVILFTALFAGSVACSSPRSMTDSEIEEELAQVRGLGLEDGEELDVKSEEVGYLESRACELVMRAGSPTTARVITGNGIVVVESAIVPPEMLSRLAVTIDYFREPPTGRNVTSRRSVSMTWSRNGEAFRHLRSWDASRGHDFPPDGVEIFDLAVSLGLPRDSRSVYRRECQE